MEFGEYIINILFVEVYIFGLFFKVIIWFVFDLSKVWVSGLGLECGKVGEVVIFIVDCLEVGEVELIIEILLDVGVKVEVLIYNNVDGIYYIIYSFVFFGIYIIIIKYGGYLVFKFFICVYV